MRNYGTPRRHDYRGLVLVTSVHISLMFFSSDYGATINCYSYEFHSCLSDHKTVSGRVFLLFVHNMTAEAKFHGNRQ